MNVPPKLDAAYEEAVAALDDAGRAAREFIGSRRPL
jgi:hypothetical protein